MYALLLICAMAIGQVANDDAASQKTYASTLQVVAGKKAEIEDRIGKTDNLTISFAEIGGQTMVTLASKNSNSLQKTEEFLLSLGLAKRIEKNSSEVTEKEASIFTTNELYLPVSHRFTKEKLALKIGGTEVPGMVRIFGPPKAIERAEQILEEYRLGTKPAPSETKVFPLKHADCSNLASTLTNAFRATKIGADPKANSITVVGDPKDITAIEVLLSNLDIKSEKKESDVSESLTKTEEVDFALVESRAQEWRALVKRYTDLKLKYDFHTATNTLNVKGPYNDITFIEMVLDEERLLRNKLQVKLAHLKHNLASELAKTVADVGPKKLKITPEAGSNSLILNGYPEDIKEAEFLIAELDVKRSEKQKKTAASPSKDARQFAYRLVNAPASEVVETLNRMEINGVGLTADERTNTVIILAEKNELKLVIGIIEVLERKNLRGDETTQAAPDPATGALWSDFSKAEAKTIATAGELRTAAAKFGNSHPTMIELRTRLETEVKTAFDLRHKLQQAEAAQLRRQLTEIEARLTKREKNKEAIIEARVNSLINMDDLGWEAMTKPKAEAEKSVAESTSKRKPTAEEMAQTQRAMTWARVDRDEYVSVKTYREYAIANDPSRTRGVESHLGVLVGGNALIAKGEIRNCEVIIGPKTLPSRLAGVAPMRVVAYRSDRYPSKGVTKLIHTAEEGESVWAFMPDEMNSLTSAKVFLSPGADLAFEKKEAFGVEAEGKLEPGYIVTNDSGEFLGVVASNRGSLGSVLSAPAIRDWIERSNLAPPTIEDPLAALAIVSAGSEQSYCPIVKGVILTQPAVVDAKPEFLAIKRFGQPGNLTIAKTSKSSNGKWGLIWIKELSPTDGFTTSEAVMHDKDTVVFVDPRRLAELQESNYSGRFNDRFGQYPTTAKILSEKVFRVLSPEFVEVRTDGGRESNTLDPGNFTAIVTTVSGHWLGAGNAVADKVSRAKAPRRWSYQFEFESADELLRLVDDESKKIASGLTTPSTTSKSKLPTSPSSSNPETDSVSRQKSASDFWNRIKEREAVIPVHAMARDQGTQYSQHPGAIVKGFIFFASPLKGGALAEVGEKSLPQRLVTITPGGLYGYHRDRLPVGYQDPTPPPKEGETIWTVSNGNYNSTISGKVFVSDDPGLEIQVNKESEFTFESDGRLEAGAVVFNDAGEFIGVVARNKGSIGVCETAHSILGAVERTNSARPEVDRIWEKAQVAIRDTESGKGWGCTVVRGVVVAPAEVLDANRTKLVFHDGEKATPISIRAATKVSNDRLALLWISDPALPSQGLNMAREKLIAGDYCRTSQLGMYSSDIESGKVKEIPAANPVYNLYASRIAKVDDITFMQECFGHGPPVCEPILDVGGHWTGLNLTKDDGDMSKPSPPPKKRLLEIIKAAEILRLIEEESKKLPPTATPETNADKPAEKTPEKPKTESPTPEAPR